MGDLTVSPATRANIDALARLLEEMDRFYGATTVDPLERRREDIRAALFSATPAGSALLAWDGSELVGLATYSFLWPAVGLTRSLFLKELYVSEVVRGKGVGRALMDALREVAVDQACSRVEWMTDKPNAGAQGFYQALSVTPDSSKIFYRVQGDDLRSSFDT